MKKKILIIDDSALMRRVISDIIDKDDRFQVEATATNGIEALELVLDRMQDFDVVLLDINMPKMNGLEFLEAISKQGIMLKVVIVSTVAKEGARETLRALELGAFDFVTKPVRFIETKSDEFQQSILKCLIWAVGLGDSGMKEESKVSRTNGSRVEKPRIPIMGQMKLVALACSTGGPKALQSIVPLLPGNLDAPVLIVQHMPEGFTQSLAQRLNEQSDIRVKEAEDFETLEKGTVYIAKGGSQMRVLQQSNGTCKVTVTKEAARNGLRPCADIMYESLVDTDFNPITCVVLTGMGGDGSKGIKQLNENKSIYVIAQDAPTCTVYGMPKMIIETGLANEVLPLQEIADAIQKNVGVK